MVSCPYDCTGIPGPPAADAVAMFVAMLVAVLFDQVQCTLQHVLDSKL